MPAKSVVVLPNSGEATPRGFEPLRAEPNGFPVHLLDHSDTVSCHFGLKTPNPMHIFAHMAAIAQLGERQTEDLKVPGSIPGLGSLFPVCFSWGRAINWLP